MKIEITFSHMDQNKIWLRGRHAAYCGTKPNMPICWLGDHMTPLTDDEKRAIVEKVLWHHKGKVKPSKWTQQFFPSDLSKYEHERQAVNDRSDTGR